MGFRADGERAHGSSARDARLRYNLTESARQAAGPGSVARQRGRDATWRTGKGAIHVVGIPMNEAREAPQVSVREAQARLEAGADALLVDVREPWEYVEVRAPGATLIPLSEFVKRFGELPHKQELLMICHSGYRSLQATIFLRRQGFARVANVIGGMDAWEAEGLPVERGRPQD